MTSQQYYDDVEEFTAVQYLEGSWGFWDETWTCWHGGFESEAAAREAMRNYAAGL